MCYFAACLVTFMPVGLADTVTLAISGFAASFDSTLQVEGLQNVLDGLVDMDETLSGQSEFVTVEPGIAMYAEMGKRGRVSWEINARYPVGSKTSLDFVMENDQSHLPGIIHQVRASLRRLGKH